MYSAVSSFPAQVSQCKEPFNDASTRTRLETLKGKALKRVTVCALGGSAFPMEMIRSWLSAEMDLDIHRDYADQLPVVRKDTLYLVLSFSGNTEEVLDCATALHRSGASLCMVTNGGNLAQFAEKHNLLRIGFPDLEDGFQPRCATGYFLGFVSGLLDSIGLTVGLFDKIEMACDLKDVKYIINLQGDEPALNENDIINLNNFMIKHNSDIGTLAAEIKEDKILSDENIVKVISKEKINYENFPTALNFTRKALSKIESNIYHHIGIYAYKAEILEKFFNLKQTKNEKENRLEQLRALDNSLNINIALAKTSPIGVDTEEEYLAIKKIMEYKS